jgi:hypothetical protein
MDDWLREGLNDIASEAPGGLEVPTTLKPRARRRMTLTVLVSLVMVSFLTVAAAAGLGAIRNAPLPGDSPSPSVELPEQDPNHVTVRLTESGCMLESSGGVADPALLRVRVVNETDDRAFIDIGRLIGDHTVGELAEHVGESASRPVRSLDTINPPFFRRHLDGYSVVKWGFDLTGFTTLPWVGETPAVWQPARKAHGGTYAMVCYRGPWPTGRPHSLVGVVGPIELAQELEDTAPDPNHVTVRIADSGCTLESSGGVVDPTLLQIRVVNEMDDRAVVDIGFIGDHTVAELADHVGDFGSRPVPSLDTVTPSFFRRHIHGSATLTRGAGAGMTPLPMVGDTPVVWRPGPGARGGTYAMICYRESPAGGARVPVGVAGPIELRPSSSVP